MYRTPKVTLEQYPTSPHLTAAVVLAALERDDVGPGRSVLDLGCGTAMLSLGCALVDTDFVVGVDCDETALEQAIHNIRELEMEDRISLIQAKVHVPRGETQQETTTRGSGGSRSGGRGRSKGGRVRGRLQQQRPPPVARNVKADDAVVVDDYSCCTMSFPLSDHCVDTVLTNPPFGTKPDKAGIDVQFLKLACRLARRAVYSFHKTSTRDYILRTMNALPNVASVAVIAEMKFDLPRTYKFHQQASVDVEVDLIRVELVGTASDSENDNASATSASDAENSGTTNEE
jgi:rRNA N6-adenosine-methyltransferase METTL5